MKLATWPIFLFFALCWLVLGVAACMTAYTWAKSIEKARRENAVHVASELARFLGTEIERFFVPLYPLRMFVERTRLIELSRIAQDFPDRDAGTSLFKDTSSLSEHPEVLSDFNTTMEGIWGALDGRSKKSTMIIQLTPRGVVTLQFPFEGNVGAIGIDVLDQSRTYSSQVRAAVGREAPSVIGPVDLIQGGKGILAYLPVYVDEDVEGVLDISTLEGVQPEEVQGRKFWGFASSIANLTKMEEWSGALRDFRYSNMHFEMHRATDGLQPLSKGGNASQIDEESHRLAHADDGTWSVLVNIPRINWELAVTWDDGFWPSWYWGACSAAIVGAWLVAVLLTCVLISRRKHRMLLYRIMPPTVVKTLHQGKQVVQHFDNVTVFFSDLVGFTNLSSRRSPLEVVGLLNHLYTEFDSLANKHKVFKSDTIGDAYMVVGGAPEQCDGPEGAARVARFALDALQLIAEADVGLAMRAGLASGPVVAAVLGTTVPKYAFFGETVNTANVMESSGRAGALQVTEGTKLLLEQSGIPMLFEEVCDNGASSRNVTAPKTFWVRRDETQPPPKSSRSLRHVSSLRKRRTMPASSLAGSPTAGARNTGATPLSPLPTVATAADATTVDVEVGAGLNSSAGLEPPSIRVDT